MLQWIQSLVRRARSPLDPHELLQDTFVNVYRYAGSFRPEASGGFRAWARTIASTSMRRARRRPRTFGVAFSDLDGEGIPDIEDPVRGPVDSAAQVEEVRDLRKAYALMLLQYAQAYGTLKERDQRALAMVEVEDGHRLSASVDEITARAMAFFGLP